MGRENSNINEQNIEDKKTRSEAQNAKAKDKEMAETTTTSSSDDKLLVYCMDLQDILSSPRLKALALYYKSKLCSHHSTF